MQESFCCVIHIKFMVKIKLHELVSNKIYTWVCKQPILRIKKFVVTD